MDFTAILAEQTIRPQAFFKDGEVVCPVLSLCVGDLVRFCPTDPNYPVDRVLGLELVENSDILPAFVRVTHASGVWSKAATELVALVGRDV